MDNEEFIYFLHPEYNKEAVRGRGGVLSVCVCVCVCVCVVCVLCVCVCPNGCTYTFLPLLRLPDLCSVDICRCVSAQSAKDVCKCMCTAVLCGVMCEEVVYHWLGASPVSCWFWFCVRDCLGGAGLRKYVRTYSVYACYIAIQACCTVHVTN